MHLPESIGWEEARVSNGDQKRVLASAGGPPLATRSGSLLGWIATALLAYFRRLPQEWPDRQAPIEDLFLLTVLLCGPAFLAAGIGVAPPPLGPAVDNGPRGRAAVLAVTAITLVCAGTLRVGGVHDLFFLGLLPAYSVTVLVELWKEPLGSEAPR